jgi:hypothetical protein
VRGPEPGLACLQGDGLGGLAGACVQRSGNLIVSEGDLLLAQVTGHVLGSELRTDVGSAAGAPFAPFRRPGPGTGKEHVEGGQVRQDPVLADVGVLECSRTWTAIAVRTRMLVRVTSRFDDSPRWVIVCSSCSDA